MQLVSKKNFLIFLATISVVALGYMALSTQKRETAPKVQPTPTYQQSVEKLQTQSSSDDTASIKKDLDNTDLTNIDQELQDIDKELNSVK